MITPKYPIFIPSKNRSDVCLTPRELLVYHVPFTLVVEPQEVEGYTARFPGVPILVLPANNQGLVFARNWIFEYSIAQGDERHWQIDDNIRCFRRRYQRRRFHCDPNIAIRAVEDFTDRYENIALSGMNYTGFIPDHRKLGPFVLNCHVYSNTLINNAIPFRYRPPANEDVDLCLQVLSGGWCTVQFNAFVVDKLRTMQMKGGQTDAAYRGDGRLFMARSLERVWPAVVETKRRFKRPQHTVKASWGRFDTPLKKKPDLVIDLSPNEYGMELVQVKPVKSTALQKLLEEQQKAKGDQT